jgi:TrmH family RNA methyltransferase
MGAVSPVKSASEIVAIAGRPPCGAARMYAGDPPLVVIAVDVQNPGNLGAIIRVAEAGGATGVVAAGDSANPFGWKALRGSMASALRLPIAVQRRSDLAIEEGRRHGCAIVAAVARAGTTHLDLDLSSPTAILVGGEGGGIAPALVDAADLRVTIPMAEAVESLNVAMATAILVYEARRQRGSDSGI